MNATAKWLHQDNIAHDLENFVVNLFEPIKDKCIGLLYGNHEESIRVSNHNNVAQNICDKLDVQNLGYSCFVDFKFHRKNSGEKHLIRGAFTHGAGAAVTEGAKLNTLMRFMKSFDADFYGYAHMHDYLDKSFTRLTVNADGRIKNKVAIGAVSGCWFRTYSQGINASYGEKKVYPPSEICTAVFLIHPDNQTIDVQRSF